MTLLKNSYKIMKDNFESLFIFQFLFIFLNFFFFVLLKNSMEGYLIKLQSLTPSIESIQNIADKTAQSAQLEALLSSLGPATQQATIILFIITPIVLLLIWIIFQGLVWKSINKKHIKNVKAYFKSFTISTIPSFLILVLLAVISIPNILFNLIIVFILFYFLTISYNVFEKTQKKICNKTITNGVKRFPYLAPFILLLFITSMTLLFLFITLYISYTTKEFFFLKPSLLVLYMCLCFVVNLFIKVVVSQKINEK